MTCIIKPISDIHVELVWQNALKEHLDYVLPYSHENKDINLILAGDIFSFEKPWSYEAVINHVKDQFKNVIYITGNHEYYDGAYPSSELNFVNYIQTVPNFYYLKGTAVELDGVVFIGVPLWTDFNKDDSAAKFAAYSFMADYTYIRKDNGKYITPNDILAIHYDELKKLTDLLEIHKDKKKIVVTHHGCSMKSIHPKYKNAGLPNYAFTSDLEPLIYKYQPELWVHGHTHESLDYKIGTTNVIVNPAGYRHRYVNKYENWNFDPNLKITI